MKYPVNIQLSRRPPGGFWIADFGLRIDAGAASLFVENHLLGSRRPPGGFWISDCGLRIDNGAASLSVGNHL